MVTDESEGDDANGLEQPRVDYNGAAQLAARLGGDTERLGDHGDDDYGHADQSKTAGFGKLWGVSTCGALGWGLFALEMSR